MTSKKEISIDADLRTLEMCFLEYICGYKWMHIQDEHQLVNSLDHDRAIFEHGWKDGRGTDTVNATVLFDDEYAIDNNEYIIIALEKIFKRGFRWRPDNGFLQCFYEDYDTPAVQFAHKEFRKAAIFCLLKANGVAILT